MSPISRRSAIVALPAGLCLAAFAGGGGAAPDFDDARSVYAALRSGMHIVLPIAGGRITLALADAGSSLDRALVSAWVRNAAAALVAYFGRFPVADYGLLVVAEPGASVGHATTWGFAGAVTRIRAGRDADAAAFARDWVLVHEMVHTALPDLPRGDLWLLEGNATWIEPIARAQAGLIDAAEVWRWALGGLPKGMAAQRGGLNGTTDHDRLYWGGALFWLLAEVGIHEQSTGRHSLRDALRAINRQSGGNIVDWSAERMMTSGDAATGGDTLRTLYRSMSTSPADTDLDRLFARLGVAARDNRIVFDDRAPLAGLRRAITRA